MSKSDKTTMPVAKAAQAATSTTSPEIRDVRLGDSLSPWPAAPKVRLGDSLMPW